MMIRRLLFGAAALLVMAIPSDAQVYSIPKHLPPAQRAVYGKELPIESDPIAELTRLQKTGDQEELNNYAMKLLRALEKDTTIANQLGSVERNYYNIIWISTGSDGKNILNRVLVHHTWSPSEAKRLPGLKSRHPEKPKPEDVDVRDVLLTNAQDARLDSIWVFTPVADPLATQLPDVVSKINPLAIIGKNLGTGDDETSSILVYVNRPEMMRSRATIAIKDTVTTLTSASVLLGNIEKREKAIGLRQARASECAKTFAQRLKDEATKVLEGPFCKETGDPCSDTLKASLTAVLPAFHDVKTNKATLEKCQAEPWWAGGPDPLTAIEQEFLKVVAEAAPTVVVGESTLSNTPLTRWSFGLMSGVYFGELSRKETRVKLDGNTIAPAPLDRVMTMVIVNYHPEPYNAEWPDVTFAERFRWFTGAVLTPDRGITFGGGLGIVRGLSVNLGIVVLFSDTVKGEDAIGGAPTDKKKPFEMRSGTAGFVGLSYVFK